MSRKMKDSGVAWLKQIPVEWEIVYPKALFGLRKEKAKADDRQLTASQQYGVIYQEDYMELTGSRVVVVEKDFDILKHVEKGDFVISMRSFQGGLEYSENSGSISSAYVMLIANLDYVIPEYYKWALKSPTYITALQSTSNLVREGQAMRYTNFVQVPLCIIPKDEQIRIADKLNGECEKIDALISNQQKQIEKLKTYKRSVITEAVTKGLNPDAEMKDSGVEWIGEIPANAKIIHLRHIVNIETGNMDTQNSTSDGKYPLYVRSPIVERCDTYTFDDEVAILMAGDGAGAGRIFHLVSGKYGCHQRVYRMNEFKYAIPKLIKYYLEVMFPILMEQGSAKSTVDSVRLPMLKSFPVVVTDNECQTEIVSFLDKKCSQIDSLISIKQQKIEKLNEYKKSIIYEYVTGKKEV